MKIEIAVMVLMLLSAGLKGAAQVHGWSVHTGDPENVLTNALHFSTPLEEIKAADYVQVLNPDADMTVRLPSGCDYASTLAPWFQANNTRSLTLDFADAIWTQCNTTDSNPYSEDKRFTLAFNSGALLAYAWSGNRQRGAFRFEDALLTLSNNVNGVRSVDFLRGSFDFLKPNGEINSGAYLYIASGASSSAPFSMNFHADTAFSAPVFLVYGVAPVNNINFSGGEHYINNFQIRVLNSGGSDVYARTCVNVLGAGTELAIGKFGANSGANLQGYRFFAGEGGTLQMVVEVNQLPDRDDSFIVSDGGRLMLGSQEKKILWNNAKLIVTNAVVDSTVTGVEPLAFDGKCSIYVKDAGWDSTSVTIGGDASQMTVDGGKFSAKSLFVGKGGSSNKNVKFAFAAGEHSLTNCYLSEESHSSSVFTISNSAVSVMQTLYLGRGINTDSTVDMAGGVLNAEQIVLGGLGSSEMNISGGKVFVSKNMGFVWNDAADNTDNVLKMTGGELTVKGEVIMVAASKSTGCKANLVLDGGVLSAVCIRSADGSSASSPAATGVAALCGNGGTIRALAADSDGLICNLNSATCGEKGLKIESEYDISIPQGFADAPQCAGELVLTGGGVKTLSGTNTVSRIVVSGGTLRFAAGAKAFSELIVTNGAKVVFADDPADVGIKGLSVGDGTSCGTIALSSGQRLAVDGWVTLNNVKLELSGDFALLSTNELISATGTVSDDSLAAWANAFIGVGFNDARIYHFDSQRSDGGVSLSMAVLEHDLVIEQMSGAREYTSDVSYGRNCNLQVIVGAEASLALSGTVSSGGLRKRGTGKFYLTQEANVFEREIVSEDGLFSVSSAGALGYGLLGMSSFRLKGGTLEFSAADAEIYQGHIVVDAGIKTAAVIKNAGDLAVGGVYVESGDLVKRGSGRLVVAPPSGTTASLSSDNGTSSNGWDPDPIAADLNESGLAPKGGYMGLNIAEGELVLSGDETTVFNVPNNTMVGMCTASLSSQPSLVVDGAKADFGGMLHLCGYQNSSSKAYCPTFTIKNGADVRIAKFMAGRSQSGVVTFPTTTVERARLSVSDFRGGYNGSCNHAVILRDGAMLNAASFLHYGPTYLDVSGSTVAKNDARECSTIEFHAKAGSWIFRQGSLLALKKMTTDQTSLANGFTLSFDGGIWETGGGEVPTFHLENAHTYTFNALAPGGLTLPVAENKTVSVARAINGAGPVVKTGKGTLAFETQGTWNKALTEKTAMDDPVSLAFSGELDVREGAVMIAQGACRIGGKYRTAADAVIDFGGNDLDGAVFAGAGRFRNFKAAGAEIALDLENVQMPQLEDCKVSGGMIVDLGRTAENPLDWRRICDLPVAKFTGDVPDVSSWKVKGTGTRNVSGRFTVSDEGIVYVTLVWKGLTLIAR